MSKQFKFAQWLSRVIDIYEGSNIEARQRRMQALADYRKEKQINDLQTHQQLKILEIQFTEQLQRVKERESRTTHDYHEFLDNIDEMKEQIVESFPDMPKVMALVIHQHAKQLVDKMWNDCNGQNQGLFQAELTSFLGLVFDDTARVLVDDNTAKIPSKTLEHIQHYAQLDKENDDAHNQL
jgi:flagellar biosynthesis GTPase FlhF